MLSRNVKQFAKLERVLARLSSRKEKWLSRTIGFYSSTSSF